MEKITSENNIENKNYTLMGADGKLYKSEEKGQFGGHKRLKIYGKLDCPSASRYIAKGQYVNERVFFTDEETAIAAGYRPCYYCMREEYREWKALKNSMADADEINIL